MAAAVLLTFAALFGDDYLDAMRNRHATPKPPTYSGQPASPSGSQPTSPYRDYHGSRYGRYGSQARPYGGGYGRQSYGYGSYYGNPYNGFYGGYQRSAMPTNESTIPTNGSAMPTNESTIPTNEGTIPTNGSAMPTHRSAMPTHRSAMPTQSSSTPPMRDILKAIEIVFEKAKDFEKSKLGQLTVEYIQRAITKSGKRSEVIKAAKTIRDAVPKELRGLDNKDYSVGYLKSVHGGLIKSGKMDKVIDASRTISDAIPDELQQAVQQEICGIDCYQAIYEEFLEEKAPRSHLFRKQNDNEKDLLRIVEQKLKKALVLAIMSRITEGKQLAAQNSARGTPFSNVPSLATQNLHYSALDLI